MVVVMELCPSRLLIMGSGVPSSSKWVAKLCRKVCRVVLSGSFALLTASLKDRWRALAWIGARDFGPSKSQTSGR